MAKKAQTIPGNQNDLEHAGFRFFAAVGRFSVKFKWLILVFWIVATMVIVHALPSLSSVTQSDNTNFLPASSPTAKALKIEDNFQPQNAVPIPMIVASSNGPLNSADQTAISQLEASVSKVSGVQKVLYRGQSQDKEAVLIDIQGSGKFDNNNPLDFINSIHSGINKVNLPSGLQVHLTGDLATEADNDKGSNKQNSELQIGTVIFIILLLLAIFRAPLAPLVTLISPVFIISIAGPIIAEAGKHGLKVSSLAQLLLTVLILGAGTDYGLFLIFRVREEMEGGLSKNDAIIKALSRVGESITFSGATVMAALLSLLFASFQIYSNLGVPLAIGIALMLIAGLTLLPALLAIFGKAVFWPLKPQNAKTKKIGLWGKWSARIVRRPALVLSIGVTIFVILGIFVTSYQSGGFGGDDSAPSTSDSSQGTALLNKHFPSNNSNPTSALFVFNQPIWSNTASAVKAQKLLASSSMFTHVTGPFNPNGVTITPSELVSLHSQLGSPWSTSSPSGSTVSPVLAELYKSTNAYISPNGKTVQFAIGLTTGDPASTKSIKGTPADRAAISSIAKQIGAKDSAIVGESSAFYDISSISNKDLVHVIPIAIIIIGLLLAVLMRSLVAPIYLVASVVLSYLASLGMSVLLFMKIGGESGIVFILPFLMFIFLLALGEDYNILVMTRIREEAHSMSLKDAVSAALNTTGTTVTSAGLVLAGTFLVLGIVSGGSGDQQVQDIGFGLAIGILMDTFIVRTVLVPSIVVLLGRYNWWPSKLSSVDHSDSE
jgi:RND superfamily putative drug exporter